MPRKKLLESEILQRLSNRPLKMIGEFVSRESKALFECGACSHQWRSIVKKVLGGTGCPKCADLARLNNPIFKKLDIGDINGRLAERKIEVVGNYLGALIKTKFKCEFDHVWEALPNNVIQRTSCPTCEDQSRRISQDKINKILNDKRIMLVGDVVASRFKTDFRCECGHEWRTTLNSLVHSSTACPVCADYGFNPKKSAILYVLKFDNFLKYGITNNIDVRLKQHKRNGVYNLAFSRNFTEGIDALGCETKIKHVLGGRFIDKSLCPDGYTETLSLEKLDDLVTIINNYINE